MTKDDITDGLADILGVVAGIDRTKIDPDAAFTDLGVDSLTMVDVVVAAEDRFGLLIDDDAWMRFRSVRQLADHIERAAAITPA